MDEKEKELEKEEKVSAKEPALEENDNWEFEAEAHTLSGSVIENDEFEIVIPEKKADEPMPKPSKKTAAAPAPAPKKKPKADKGIFAATAVVVALVIAACVALGVFFYAVPSKTINENKLKPADVAMTLGDVDISLGMYSYYYSVVSSDYVSNAGYGNNLDISIPLDQQTTKNDDGETVTWAEYLEQETQEKLKFIIGYYDQGVKKGIALSKDQKEQIEQSISQLEEYAKENGMTVDAFIAKNYGEYCTFDTLKLMLEQCYVAETYYQEYLIETRATVEEEQAYFEKNSKDNYNDYQSVNAALLQISYDMQDDASRKDAVSKAEKYAKSIKSVDDMKKLIPVVYKDDIKAYIEQGGASNEEECVALIASSMQQDYCIAKLSDGQRLGEDLEKWLFDSKVKPNTAKAFDIEDDGVVYILLKNSQPTLDEEEIYSVRHILIKPITEDGKEKEKYTKAEWAAAKEKADKLLDEYNQGGKTEYAFALLADKNSDDTSSTSAGGSGIFGGLIASAHKGEMVKSFENWAFEDGRKYGDVGVVKSQYGYHVMYFVERDKTYLQLCESGVATEKEDKFLQDISIKSHKKKIALVRNVIDEANKTAAEQAASAQNQQ